MGGSHFHIDRGFPVGVAQDLAFGEENHVVLEGVGRPCLSTDGLQGDLLVDDDDLQTAISLGMLGKVGIDGTQVRSIGKGSIRIGSTALAYFLL